jgi:hypothetical protein
LISAGHFGALDYTPRQAAAFLRLVRLRKRREASERLAIVALGSRGDPDEVNKTLKAWE